MIPTMRLSPAVLLFNLLNLHACRITSLRSDDTFMTKHFPRNARQSFGRKYKVLMETCPDMATECGVFAGIQIARSGGTTQTPCLVDRVITPSEAKSSWSSGWECSGI